MNNRFDPERWRARTISALAQLTAIFVGVTLAFLFEGYRKQIDEAADLRQAVDNIVTELGHFEEHGTTLAERIAQSIEAWHEADHAGRQEAPVLHRIPGAQSPPTAAWDSAVSSGLANRLEPALRLELGWFYSEYVGIHANYARRESFAEQEVMPRALQGAAAFYGSDGKLRPEFQVHLALMGEFAADLKRLSLQAGELKRKLQAREAGQR